jgi:excisionase family DNA binding protein
MTDIRQIQTAPPARPTLIYSLDYIRNNAQDLMTREQAAKYLGLAPQTLAVWAMQKHRMRHQLPFIKVGRLIRYRKVDLDEFIRLHTCS